MLAIPAALASIASQKNIPIPDDPTDFDPKEFPHFAVFLNFQTGRPIIGQTSHFGNAEIIASLSDEKIMQVTIEELLAKGCR